MAIIKLEGARNVVEAAEKRIINVFNNGLPVYFAFSGGKDSLCLSQLIVNPVSYTHLDVYKRQVYWKDDYNNMAKVDSNYNIKIKNSR